MRRRLPEDARLDEIVVTGGGQQNGMLLREIGRLTELPIVRLSEYTADDALAPATSAVLALLHLDQVPANRTAITGAEVPRILGRLTPGSPQNWQKLMRNATGGRPTVRPLRSAM